MGVEYKSKYVLSKRDVDKLGLKLNVVEQRSLDCEYHILPLRTPNGDMYVYSRDYKFNGYKGIRLISLRQDIDGLVSSTFRGSLSGLSAYPSLMSKDSRELTIKLEEQRLAGNKWFSNNGKSFTPPKKSVAVKTTSAQHKEGKPKSKFGLLTDALKNS